MEIGPVPVVKRKGEPSITSYDFCIICQNVTKELLRNSSNEGKIKVKECVKKRRKFRDMSSVIVLDRLDAVPDCEWEGDRLKWHKSCYSSFTSANHIKRLQNKYEKEIHKKDDSETPSTSRRKSSEPVDFQKCIFCQKVDKQTLHNIETLEKSKQILMSSALDHVMRLRLSGINDLIAAEGKYHLKCLVQFERNTKKHSQSGSTNEDYALTELCHRLENGLARGHVFDMGDVWKNYVKIAERSGESEIPQKYVSRRQTFHEDLRELLGNKASFVRPLDPKASLLMYPGDQTDFYVAKTLSKAVQKETEISSETDSSEDSSDEGPNLVQTTGTNLLQDMVHVAIRIRADLRENPGHSGNWKELSQEHVEKVIPDSLFIFLSLLFGGISALEEPENSQENINVKRKICSIAQDIVYGVSDSTKLTPKHIGLGLALHQATRSENLVNLFHAANHVIGIETIRRFDNGIANSILDKFVQNGNVYVPDNIAALPLIQFSCDNIDVLEATLDGKNTFHCTQMMAWQRSGTIQTTEESVVITSRSRKLDSNVLKQFHDLDKAKLPVNSRPKPVFPNRTVFEMEKWLHTEAQLREASLIDMSWIIARIQHQDDQKIPLWGGFNESFCTTDQPITHAGMLPILQAPADDYNTMTTVINRFLDISKHFGQPFTVITADQPLYSKGKELVWADQEKYSNVIFRMGSLHVCFNFLKAIGQHVQNAGLDDVWIEAGVFAPNTSDTVLEGKAYYRAIRGHTLAYESLWRIRWQFFKTWLQTKGKLEMQEINTVAQLIVDAFRSKERNDIRNSVDGMNDILKQNNLANLLQQFDEHNGANKNYVFWTTYMHMVEVLLNFIRAEREGNWELHLEAFAAILPWLTVYDHTNYSRWGPIYLTEMMSLEQTAPEVYQEFKAGNFVIKRSNNLFNQVPPDQATEWINKICKSAGGIIGITRSDQARDRFCTTWATRSQISQETKILFGLLDDEEEVTYTRNDSLPSRIKIDEEKVKSLTEQFSILDVFHMSPNQGDSDITEEQKTDDSQSSNLIALATKDVAFQDIADNLLKAEERGIQTIIDFSKKRIKDQVVGFYEPIKKLKSKTFASMFKATVREKVSEQKVIKADRKLLQRLFNAASSGRSVQISEVLKHELSPVPLSLANANGKMNPSSKADLLPLLTTDLKVEITQELPKTDNPTCVLIDGHALIQSLGKPHGCQSFGDYANVFYKAVIKHLHGSSTRVDITFDRYLGSDSIKSATRSKRTGRLRPIRKLIQGPGVPLPQVWNQFIAMDENKADLAHFLSEEILQRATSLPDNCEVVVGDGFHDSLNARSNKREVSSLAANHEEADTRLILHALDAYQRNYKRIAVICRDTDVLLLLLFHLGNLSAEVWMIAGTAKQRKCFPVHSIARNLDSNVIRNVLCFHAFTGCDTTSSFSGFSKKSCWKLFQKYPTLLGALGRDGDTEGAEEFICKLYGGDGTEIVDVDLMRYNLFSKAKKSLDLLPPTKDALELHCRRVNFQAKIRMQACVTHIEVGLAVDTGGWQPGQKGLEAVWTRLPAVPKACVELTTCGCKSKCSTVRCKCYKSGQICIFECSCDAIDCANAVALEAAFD